MQDKPKQMSELLQYKDCSYIKGSSYEGNFFLCSNTTEPNYSICDYCQDKCHKGHSHITLAKGNYQCHCAKDHHNTLLNVNAKDNTKTNQCIYQDLYKHSLNEGFYYVKENNTTTTYCCICSDYCLNKLPSGKVTKEEDKQCNCPHHEQCNAFLISKLLIHHSTIVSSGLKFLNTNKKQSFRDYFNLFNITLLMRCPKTNDVTLKYVYDTILNANRSDKDKLLDPILQNILQLYLIALTYWKKNIFYSFEPFETDVYDSVIELINEAPSISYTLDEQFSHLKTQLQLALILFNVYVRGKYTKAHNHWTCFTIQNMNIYQRFKYIINKDTSRSKAFCIEDNKDVERRNEIIHCLLIIYEQLFREFNGYAYYFDILIKDLYVYFIHAMKFGIKYCLISESLTRKLFELINETIPKLKPKLKKFISLTAQNANEAKGNLNANPLEAASNTNATIVSNVITEESLNSKSIQSKPIKESNSNDDAIKILKAKSKAIEDKSAIKQLEFKSEELSSNTMKIILYYLLYYNDKLTMKAMDVKFGHKQERTFAFTVPDNKNDSQTMDNIKTIFYSIIDTILGLVSLKKIEMLFDLMTQKGSFYVTSLNNLKYLPVINEDALNKVISVNPETINSITKRLRQKSHDFNTFKLSFGDYGKDIEVILSELKDNVKQHFHFDDLSIEYLNFYKKTNADDNERLKLQRFQNDVKNSELYQALSEIISIVSQTEEFIKQRDKIPELDNSNCAESYPTKDTRIFILQLYYLLIINDIESLTLIMNVNPRLFVWFFSQMTDHMLYFYKRIVEILYFSPYLLANTNFFEFSMLYFSSIMAKAKKMPNLIFFYAIQLTQLTFLLFNKLGVSYHIDLANNVQYIFNSFKANYKELFKQIFTAYFEGNWDVLDKEKISKENARDCIQSYFKFVAQFDSLEISKYNLIHDAVTPLFFDYFKTPEIMKRYIGSLEQLGDDNKRIGVKVIYPLLRFYIQRTAVFRPNIEMGNQMILNLTNDLKASSVSVSNQSSNANNPFDKEISNTSLIKIFKLPNISNNNNQTDQIKAQMTKLFDSIDFITLIAENFNQIFMQHIKEKDTFPSMLELKVTSYLFIQNILIKPTYYLLKAAEVYLIYFEGIMFDHIHQMLFYVLKALTFFYTNTEVFEREGLNTEQNLTVHDDFNQYVDIEIEFTLTKDDLSQLNEAISQIANCKYFNVKDYIKQYEDILIKVFPINIAKMPKENQFNASIDNLIKVYEEEIIKGSVFTKFKADRIDFAFFQSVFFEMFTIGGKIMSFAIKKIFITRYMVCLLETIIDSVTKKEDKEALAKTLKTIVNQSTLSNFLMILSFSSVCEVIRMFQLRKRGEIMKKSIHVEFNTALSKYFQMFCEGNNVSMKEFLFQAKYTEPQPMPVLAKKPTVSLPNTGNSAANAIVKKQSEVGVEVKKEGVVLIKDKPIDNTKPQSETQSQPPSKSFLQSRIEAKALNTDTSTQSEQGIAKTQEVKAPIKPIDDPLKEKAISFFNIICSNMKLIQFKSEDNESYCLTTQIYLSIKHYLNTNTNLIYNCYKDLLIEMIQGYPFTSDIFSKAAATDSGLGLDSTSQAPFAFYYLCENMNGIILNTTTSLDLTMINMKIDLFEILVNIINQKYSYDSNANFLSVFDINHITNLLVYYIKYLYLTYCKKVNKFDRRFEHEMENLVFSDKTLTEMMHNYKRDQSIFKDLVFQLSRNMYLFIKLLGDKCCNRTALVFLENSDHPFSHAKTMGDIAEKRNLNITTPPSLSPLPSQSQSQPANDNKSKHPVSVLVSSKVNNTIVTQLEKTLSSKIFTCRFFNKIMKKIEIINVIERVKETRNVIFLHDPKIYIINNKEMDKVLNNANRTSRATKLKSIVESLPDLTEKIKYKTLHPYNPKWRYLYEFNYVKVDMFNCFLTVIINILFLQLLDNTNIVSTDILSKGAKFLECTLVIVNAFFLIVFLITKYPLYVHLNKLKHFSQKNPKYYNLINVYLFDSYVFNEEIDTMVIVTLIAVFSLFSKYEVILFSLQLLTIAKFSSTIQEIMQAFSKRFSQLMAMIFFLGILTFFFANYDYFFLKDSFVIEQETGEVLNTCSSLLECFLTIFNNGVQSGGGIGDVLGDASYKGSGYYQRWVHDMIFYIIVMMFLLNMINGIIITTFSQLREESNEKEEDMKNICFICSIPTYELEKKNVTLKQHFKKVHNLKTYVRYLAMLYLMNDNDMDQDQFYVYNCLMKKSMEFFPEFEENE